MERRQRTATTAKPAAADLARNATAATKLLKALANRHRLLILCQLGDGELRVHQLGRLVGLSPSALSQHLAGLKRLDIVDARRDARAIFYRLRPGPAQDLIKTLVRIYCPPAIAPAAGAKRTRRRPVAKA